MQMKSLAMLLAALALTGCGKEPVSTAPTPAANHGSINATTAECAESAVNYDPMPEGMTVNIPYHLRGDRIYADAKGNYRRRVTLEYLDGDAGSVFDAAFMSLTSAGYVAKKKWEKDGRFGSGFNKKGVGALLLSVNPKAVPKPAHPDAKGMLVLDYPYPGKIVATARKTATAL